MPGILSWRCWTDRHSWQQERRLRPRLVKQAFEDSLLNSWQEKAKMVKQALHRAIHRLGYGVFKH